jgi:hypothetical protein
VRLRTSSTVLISIGKADNMQRRRIAAIAAAGVVAAGGTGVALATTRGDDAKQREQAVLDDAAKRLGVEPSELRDALAKAQDDQLDAAVKAGRLTQEQADAIKQRRSQSGLVLGGGHPGPGGPGFGHRDFRGGPGFGHGGPPPVLDAAANALGLTDAQLFARLRSGKSLQDIAKAQGKDYAAVKSAIRSAIKTDLDAAVKDKRLTQAQADELLDHLTEHLDNGFFFGRHGGPPPGPPPPPPGP